MWESFLNKIARLRKFAARKFCEIFKNTFYTDQIRTSDSVYLNSNITNLINSVTRITKYDQKFTYHYHLHF